MDWFSRPPPDPPPGSEGFTIEKIDKATCDLWVTKKHYSRRAPVYWEGFGLISGGMIQGVCVYGQPNPPVNKYAFKDRDFRLYELTRLVIQTTAKNAASILVGRSLQMLKAQPCAVVSYADTEQGHAGIIYQATNWLYTGATVSHDHAYLINGKRVHPMSLRDQGITNPKEWARANNIQTVKPAEKHRYFFLVGSKKERRVMLSKLAYPVISTYPKCDQRRYDAGPLLETKAPTNS